MCSSAAVIGRLSVDLNFKNVTNDTYVNANGTFVFRRRQK